MWPFHFKNWDKIGKVYSADCVRQILKNAGVKGNISLRDQDYRAIDDADFERLRDTYCIFGDIQYRKKVYECEDFVYRMWSGIVDGWADKTTTEGALALLFGYMDGIVISDTKLKTGHAWIFRIRPNGTLAFYQGQSGKEMTWTILSMGSAEA